MATITVTNDLDVAEKYEILVQQSLAGNSAYIRAKETIEDLVTSGAIDEAQKAEIISSVVGGIINNITSSSMSTAMSWANAEKEVALKKLELAKQLDILEEEISVKAAQGEQISNATRLAKVESKRVYGTAVFDTEDNLLSLLDDGKVAKDIELTDKQIAKATTEDLLLNQKITESHAAVHKIVADTYTNYGHYTYGGVSSSGIATVTRGDPTHKTLSDSQQDIAIEQAKGYTYNAWANALTGASSMVGTALASEVLLFNDGSVEKELLTSVKELVGQLQNATTSN
jgi:hypothetical protein